MYLISLLSGAMIMASFAAWTRFRVDHLKNLQLPQKHLNERLALPKITIVGFDQGGI